MRGHAIFLDPFTALTILTESLLGPGFLQKWFDAAPSTG